MPSKLALVTIAVFSIACGDSSGDHGRAAVHFSPTEEGLQEQHQRATPMLEIYNCPPRRAPSESSACSTSRLYADGEYYVLSNDQSQPAHWGSVTRLRPEGVRELGRLFTELCDASEPVMANDSGSTTYRVHIEDCSRQFVITGVPEGRLARMRDVHDIIHRNIIPVTTPAPAADPPRP